MEKVSVIVPTYDNHDTTLIHVREAMNSSRVPDEIIVVNDGGDVSLLERLKELKRNTKVIYAYVCLPKIPWNYNGACNLGVWLSIGEYIVFEDNDNIPSKYFYEEALKVLNENPPIGRVLAKHRVWIEDIHVPFEQWKTIKNIGMNQGTYMMRRDVYTRLKGQDERFCGRYGWMYYDWKRRLLNKGKIQFSTASFYYYTDKSQSNLPRGMDKENFRYYRYNLRDESITHPNGILNFGYTVDYL